LRSFKEAAKILGVSDDVFLNRPETRHDEEELSSDGFGERRRRRVGEILLHVDGVGQGGEGGDETWEDFD